jgi:hypothetical protein
MEDTQFYLTTALLLAGILYVTVMYLYRKMTAGEPFDIAKYAQTFGYVALVAVAAYITSGVVPEFDVILAQIMNEGIPVDISQVLPLIMTVIIAIIHKYFKQPESQKPAG